MKIIYIVVFSLLVSVSSEAATSSVDGWEDLYLKETETMALEDQMNIKLPSSTNKNNIEWPPLYPKKIVYQKINLTALDPETASYPQKLSPIANIKKRIGFFNWKTQDQILFSIFVGMQTIDILQTGRYQESAYLCEGNILLAKGNGDCNPNMLAVAGAKAGMIALTYWMTNAASKYENHLWFGQTTVLIAMNAFQLWVINHNKKVLSKYNMSGIAGLKINLAHIGFKF